MNTYHTKFNHWTRFANQSIAWYGTDSYECFQRNFNDNPLEMQKYIDMNITYKFNSEGFRCNEFTDKPGAIFLGCSITQGVGVALEDTFPFIVTGALGLECWNLAVAGRSADASFRVLLNYIDKLNVKLVVTHFVMTNRFELLTDESSINFMPSMYSENEHLHEYYKLYLSTEENAYLNTLKNVLSIKQLCSARGIKFIDSADKLEEPLEVVTPMIGRDLLHPGKGAHFEISKNILEKYGTLDRTRTCNI